MSDEVHQALKEMAFNTKTTITDLVLRAIHERYFFPDRAIFPKPFSKLKGSWKKQDHSQKDLNALKSLWKPKKDLDL